MVNVYLTVESERLETPMVYTLGEAANAVGKSKATISKAIKNGRISAQKQKTAPIRSIRQSCTGFTRQSVQRLKVNDWKPLVKRLVNSVKA